jgi:hypothetical protein
MDKLQKGITDGESIVLTKTTKNGTISKNATNDIHAVELLSCLIYDYDRIVRLIPIIPEALDEVTTLDHDIFAKPIMIEMIKNNGNIFNSTSLRILYAMSDVVDSHKDTDIVDRYEDKKAGLPTNDIMIIVYKITKRVLLDLIEKLHKKDIIYGNISKHSIIGDKFDGSIGGLTVHSPISHLSGIIEHTFPMSMAKMSKITRNDLLTLAKYVDIFNAGEYLKDVDLMKNTKRDFQIKFEELQTKKR